jgi:hypothetical protein
MKPVDKKDLPKLIALIVLAAGVFGFFVMQMAAPPPAASKAPATAAAGASPEKAAADNTATTAKVGEAEEAGVGTASAYDPTRVVFSPAGRDPFMPNGAAAVAMASTGRVAVKPSAPITGGVSGSFPRLPGVIDRIMASRPVTPAPAPPVTPVPQPAGPVEIPAPAAPEFDVTGVVLGEGGSRSVAILRGADDERRFVMVGDDIGLGFVVTAIHANGIDVRDPNGLTPRIVTIKLGNTESSRAN